MARLRVSRDADKDLVGIFAYIALDNLTAARRMNATLRTAMETIAGQPGIGRQRGDLGTDLRSLPVAPYVIYYRYSKGTVRIIRVVHGARDIREL